MSKIAVVGGSGFLGNKLLKMLSENYSVVGTYQNKEQQGLHKLDITDKRNIDEFMSRVLENGGISIVDKTSIPNKGFMAYAADPEGNIFGLIEKVA